MEFSTPRPSERKTVPIDASSLIPPGLDRIREHPEVVCDEVPCLSERLAEVSDPRDQRGIRHALVAVLALTACAVLAGATSVLAVSEWIADASPHILDAGIRLAPLFPKRFLPAETTVRRLLARIDGDALDRAVARWLADRRPPTADRRPPTAARRRAGCAASQWAVAARSWRCGVREQVAAVPSTACVSKLHMQCARGPGQQGTSGGTQRPPLPQLMWRSRELERYLSPGMVRRRQRGSLRNLPTQLTARGVASGAEGAVFERPLGEGRLGEDES
jgi:hypothetical protein